MRVYIAGKLGSHSPNVVPLPIDYIYNVNAMVKVNNELTTRGYATHCPALDILSALIGGKQTRLSDEEIKALGMEWLEVSDAVVLCPKWKESPGTLAEIKRADELGIPVFNSLRAFLERDDD